MSRSWALESSAIEVGEVKDITGWLDVGVTVDVSGATTPAGKVQGSRGLGAITNIWEDLMDYADAPVQIPNSIRRIRLNTTGLVAGKVVVEAVGN